MNELHSLQPPPWKSHRKKMFRKNRTVAWSGFRFLTFKMHIVPECQGPVVTTAPSQKKLRWGPFWGRLWTALQTVREGKGGCPPTDCSGGPASPCSPLANLHVGYIGCLFYFLFIENLQESCMNSTKNSCSLLPRIATTLVLLLSFYRQSDSCSHTCIHV